MSTLNVSLLSDFPCSYCKCEALTFDPSVLRSEVCDLRVVLQSSDKQLEEVRREQERENTQLSSSLISTQLQLDKVR